MIFKKPIITENAFLKQQANKYVFSVDVAATKPQIKLAFKEVFGVEPLSVSTLIIKGKQKTNWKTRKPFAKSDKKKAIVTVKKDVKIDLLALNKTSQQ